MATFLKQSVFSKWIVRRNGRTRGDGVDQFTPYFFPGIKTLYRFIEEKQPKIVILRPVFTFYSYQLILLSFFMRYKVVFYSQIRINKSVSLYKRVFLEIILWLTRSIWISPCPGDVSKYSPISKKMYLFPFVKKMKLTSRDSYFNDQKINILVVAKIFPPKNIELAIEVFIELRQSYSDIRLTICAGSNIYEPYHDKLKALIDTSDVKNDIKIQIGVPYEEMTNVYMSHDILILPSNYDQAALVPVESMGHGLVTFASQGNGTSNYITDGVDGYTFEKRGKEELLDKLEKLLKDRSKIPVMGNKAIETVRLKHNPEKVIEDFLKRLNVK